MKSCLEKSNVHLLTRIEQEGQQDEATTLPHLKCFVQQRAGKYYRTSGTGSVAFRAILREAKLAAIVILVQVYRDGITPISKTGIQIVTMRADEIAAPGIVAGDHKRFHDKLRRMEGFKRFRAEARPRRFRQFAREAG